MLIIVPVLILSAYGQPPDFNTGQNNCFLENNEKVFVQLDKNICISGQPLMYKAYVVNASSLIKSEQSRIIYFEITGNNNLLVHSWRSNLNKGLCHGSVIIPDTISGGIYTLRAYTNWMRNTSPAFHFKTRIIITKINESDLDQLQGPAILSDNKAESQSLPADTNKSGYNLDIQTSRSDIIVINISSGSEEVYDNGLFHLIIQSRGKIISNIPVTLSNGEAKVTISKNDIPAGILDFILFNPFNNQVTEKLIYIYPENYPSLTINTSQRIYGKKDKVRLELELNNIENPDTAWLSISVTEKTPFQTLINNTDIASYLLFYSELANPAGFHGSLSTITGQSANNVLQRTENDRYAWNLLSYDNKRPCPFIMENKGFVLTGKVLHQKSREPVKNKLVILSFPDSIASLKYCFTDSGGNFYFLLDQSFDNRDLILQLINYDTGSKSIIWEIDNKFGSEAILNYKPLLLSPEANEYLEYCRKITLVNNIYRAKERNDSMPADTYNVPERRNFCGKPDYIVYPADFVELLDFREISENILPAVKFRKKGDIYYVQIYDFKNQIIMPPEATVLLNNVPCESLDYISPLSTNDISRIDVYQSQILYGELSFYGLLSVYTYDGKIPESYLDNHAYIIKNKVQRPYVSAYSIAEPGKGDNIKNQPDFRQTLYWNPGIIMSGQNKAIIEFNTSELKAGYNIIVQGITSHGIPLEATYEITVK